MWREERESSRTGDGKERAMRRQYLAVAVFLGMAMLLLTGCPQQERETTEAPTEPTISAEATVAANDQSITASRVVVQSVVATQAGWIVIHQDVNGQPGPVIGNSAINMGENPNVVVAIDDEQATPTLWAMLHLDDGEIGVFEFPDGDPPVMLDGAVVMDSFQSGASAEPVPEVTPTPSPGQEATPGPQMMPEEPSPAPVPVPETSPTP